MRSSVFRNVIFAIWIMLCVSNIINLVQFYISYGNAAFSNYVFIFECLLVLLMLLSIVALYFRKMKYFTILFGIYVATEAAFALTDSITFCSSCPISYVFENYADRPQNICYYFIQYYFYPVVMILYAIAFAVALILRLRNYWRVNFFVNLTIDVGYAVALINVAVLISGFTTVTTGFSFLTILLDLLTTFFFSLVYIYVPRNLYK